MAKSSNDSCNFKGNINPHSLKSIDEYKTTIIENLTTETLNRRDQIYNRNHTRNSSISTMSWSSKLSSTECSPDPVIDERFVQVEKQKALFKNGACAQVEKQVVRDTEILPDDGKLPTLPPPDTYSNHNRTTFGHTALFKNDDAPQVEYALFMLTKQENVILKKENAELNAQIKKLRERIAMLTNPPQMQSQQVQSSLPTPMSHINAMGSQYGNNSNINKNPTFVEPVITDNDEIKGNTDPDTTPVTDEDEDYPSVIGLDDKRVQGIINHRMNGSSPNSRRSLARKSIVSYSNLISIDGSEDGRSVSNEDDGSVPSEIGPIHSFIQNNRNPNRRRANSESLSLGIALVQTDTI